jgi:hypothetical protein
MFLRGLQKEVSERAITSSAKVCYIHDDALGGANVLSNASIRGIKENGSWKILDFNVNLVDQ